MLPSIPFIIALFVLIWFSHALTKIFQRQVDPMRRRDVTLAGAEKGEALEMLIVRAFKPALLGIVVILSSEILFFAWSMLNHEDGPLQRTIVRALSATIILLMTVPMCFVVVALISARACRANRPLPLGTITLGVILPVIALLPLRGVVSLAFRVFALMDHGGLMAVMMLGVLVIAALLMGTLVFLMPYFAINIFKKAYPYTE